MVTRKSKKTAATETVPDPIEYDPLNPELTVLHRAGIAGLLLQIRTMERASEEDKEDFVIPQYEPIHDGRGIRIKFTKESFHSLMRERYQAVFIEKVSGKERDKPSKEEKDQQEAENNVVEAEEGKKTKKKLPTPKRYICKWPRVEGRFVYYDLFPLLRSFEVFEANEIWQQHARDAMWKSYYSIYKTQGVFKFYSEFEEGGQINDLWEALLEKQRIGLRKQYYPSVFDKNLKGVEINEQVENALLLHFWPLVATHFIPVSLKIDKDKKTGQKILRHDWQRPVVVIPDVVNAENFVSDFIEHLGTLGETPSGKLYDDGRYIATPLEASLAFFFAPRKARGTSNKIGTRGAEVYVFRQRPKIDKQPLVTSIVNESFEPQLVNEYERLMKKKITSLPFRAICVENLLEKRGLYEGFERLVDQYPLELFVAIKPKDKVARRFNRHGYQMARSLFNEFRSIKEKERKNMNGAEPTIPSLIWRITRSYVRWRASSKADPPVDESRLNALFEKRRNKQTFTADEEKLLKRYNAAVGDVVEKLFIDFRGYREMEAFANAFTETLFRAPQNLKPELADKLQPFYEGAEWESGRRLVLMAISAAGANASARGADDDANDVPDAASTETEETD
jgi:CRISPR-associated protein Cmx8